MGCGSCVRLLACFDDGEEDMETQLHATREEGKDQSTRNPYLGAPVVSYNGVDGGGIIGVPF
jgi:hypothetical protein